jgi:hypothetical protein
LVTSVKKLEVRWNNRKESMVPKRTFSDEDFIEGTLFWSLRIEGVVEGVTIGF